MTLDVHDVLLMSLLVARRERDTILMSAASMVIFKERTCGCAALNQVSVPIKSP